MSFTNDPSQDVHLGRSMVGPPGEEDPTLNYNVFRNAAKKIFGPGYGVKGERTVKEMRDEGFASKGEPTPDPDDPGLESLADDLQGDDSFLPDAEDVPAGRQGDLANPMDEQLQPEDPTAPGEPGIDPSMPTDPLVSPIAEPVSPGLPEVKGATAEEIASKIDEAADLEPRTRKRNINIDYLDEQFDSIGNAKDIGYVLEAQADKFVDFDDVRTFEQERASVGEDHVGIMRDVLTEKPAALSSRQLLAGREMLLTLTTELESLAKKIANKQATPEDMVKFDKLSDQTASLQHYMQGKVREAARALNSMKIVAQTIKGADPYTITREADPKSALERANIIISAKRNGATPGEIVERVGQAGKLRKSMTALINYRNASILTGIKTNMVNTINNTFMGGLRTLLVRPTAAAVGYVRTGNALGADRVYLAETAAEIGATIHSFMDAMMTFRDTWMNGAFANQGEYISAFGGRKIDEAAEEDWKLGDALQSVAGDWSRKTGAPQALNAYHRGVDAISFGFLTAGDDFFKVMHYNKSIHGQAIRQALMEGLDGEAATKRANEILGKITRKMHEEAMRQAEEQTFTNKEDVTKVLNHFADALVKGNALLPPLKLFFTFVRTPTAIFDRTIKMSPLAPLQEAYKRRIDGGGPEADMARAELIVGTSIATLLTALGAMGLVTGNGPSRSQDPTGAQRKALMASGWQPNSYMDSDGKLTSLARGMDPVMLPALAVIQNMEAARFARDEVEAWDYTAGAILTGASMFMDNTFMSGVLDIAAVATGRIDTINYTARQVASLVPSAGKDIKDLQRMWADEEGRPATFKTDNLAVAVMQQLATRVPGVEPQAMVRYWDGDVAVPGGNDAMVFWNTVLPIRSSYLMDSEGRQADPATEAIIENALSPSMPQSDIVLDPRTGFSINLMDDIPNGALMYDRLLQLVGKERRRQIEAVMAHPQYQEFLDNGWVGPRSYAAMALQSALDDGLKLGKAQFMAEIRDPEFPLNLFGETAEKWIPEENLVEFRQLVSEDAVTEEEKEFMIKGGFKGIGSRDRLLAPKGPGSDAPPKESIPAIEEEEWVPKIK